MVGDSGSGGGPPLVDGSSTVPEGWTDDGHVLVVAADGPFPEDGDVRWSIECPSNCDGPFMACSECEGSGYISDDEDEEIACPDCDESGKEGGKHACWFQHGLDLWDSLDDAGIDRYQLGRFRMLYRMDGYFEDFRTEIRRGQQIKAGSL